MTTERCVSKCGSQARSTTILVLATSSSSWPNIFRIFFWIIIVRIFWAIIVSSCLVGTLRLRIGYSRVSRPGGPCIFLGGVTGGVSPLLIVQCSTPFLFGFAGACWDLSSSSLGVILGLNLTRNSSISSLGSFFFFFPVPTGNLGLLASALPFCVSGLLRYAPERRNLASCVPCGLVVCL